MLHVQRLRIHHVDQQTGLTWTSGLGAGDSPAYDDDARLFKCLFIYVFIYYLLVCLPIYYMY